MSYISRNSFLTFSLVVRGQAFRDIRMRGVCRASTGKWQTEYKTCSSLKLAGRHDTEWLQSGSHAALFYLFSGNPRLKEGALIPSQIYHKFKIESQYSVV